MFLHNLSAINVPACNDPNASNDSCVNIPKVEANSGQVTQMLQLAFGIIGVIAVVVIIIGAIELMTSLGGNPEAAKKARNTIIYAAIGLIVAISAEFIVTFVLNKL